MSINGGKDTAKRELNTLLVGVQSGGVTIEVRLDTSQSPKNRTSI